MEQDELYKFSKEYKSNRAERRRKPPTDPRYTKATHKLKKERAKNVKSKQQRKRAIAQARKARKQSYSQVS
jgi:hypothetical protein